jgi:hypothetical protein
MNPFLLQSIMLTHLLKESEFTAIAQTTMFLVAGSYARTSSVMISDVINPVVTKAQGVGVLAETIVEVDMDGVIEVDELRQAIKFAHLLLEYSTRELQASEMISCSTTVPLTTCLMIVPIFTTTGRTTITAFSQILMSVCQLWEGVRCRSPMMKADVLS